MTPVVTKGGEHFVATDDPPARWPRARSTPALGLKDEVEIGHIELSRAADFCSFAGDADLCGEDGGRAADDLATTLLLATDKPVCVAPA